MSWASGTGPLFHFENGVQAMRTAVIATAILVSTIAVAHAESSQVRLPDGRIVTCDLPPKYSDRVGRCADGESIVWNDRDQSYYVIGQQNVGPTWGTITIPSQMSTFSPGLMYLGGLATHQP
jgi:hypothetical protein